MDPMDKLGKYLLSCIFVILAFSCVFLINPADAQTQTPPPYLLEPSYPTPSIPEFTVALAGPPFTQPTTYILNDSTGQNEPQIGFTNEYTSVNVTVKNQPFTPFDSGFNGNVSLMYNIRIKDHQSIDNWTEVYSAYFLYLSNASNTSTTELAVPIQGEWTLGPIAGAQIDIQVQAMIGTVHRQIWPYEGVLAPWFFDGQVSGWSNTETVNIPANTPLNFTPSPTPVSSTSSFPLTSAISVVIIALLLIVIVYLLFYLRRRKLVDPKS